MRAKEFIQSLMKAAQQAGPGVTINIGEINIDSKDEPEEEVETALDTDRFVPPLQQKIELMKKQTGTKSSDPSIYNDDDLLDD
jgi:hypothetical protein